MKPIHTREENPDGLYRRYLVKKADGTPTDPGAEYFVLRLNDGGSDPAHIKAGLLAIRVYSYAIERELPKLAKDLRERYGE